MLNAIGMNLLLAIIPYNKIVATRCDYSLII